MERKNKMPKKNARNPKAKTIKPTKPKNLKKTYSSDELKRMSQSELNYLAKREERRIQRLFKATEKKGFRIDSTLKDSSRYKAPKKATAKTIERLQTVNKDTLRTNKKISLTYFVDNDVKVFKGAKAFDLMDQIQKEARLQKRWDDFKDSIGSGKEVKAPKIEKYKNPLARKKVIDPETGEKYKNRINLRKDYFGSDDPKIIDTKPEEPVYSTPDNPFEDPSFLGLMGSLDKVGNILGYATGSNPFGQIQSRIEALKREKGDDGAFDYVMNQYQIPEPYMYFIHSDLTRITETNVPDVLECLSDIGLINDQERETAYQGLELWNIGFETRSIPTGLIPANWNKSPNAYNMKGVYDYA